MPSPNIVFILTDQERHFPQWPGGFDIPGRLRLQEAGTTFTNHMIASCVCTPSRSTIYGGEHIQQTTVFDNINFPWSNDLPSSIRTIGHRLRDLGYFSAYLGKWHLSRELDTSDVFGGPNPEFRNVLDGYGFSDFVGPGDVIGLTRGGHTSDEVIAAVTRRWLRLRARQLADEGTPWFLAVNLVNPHDVMFYDTDLPGQSGQKSDLTMMQVARAPRSPIYEATWDLPLPETRHERWDEPGRPAAHHEFQEARRYLVGLVPDEDDRWQRLQDYYLNCIRECDRHVEAVLDELEIQGFLDDAMVVFTADHGELGGAHGMSGKGASAYREQNNVPLIVKHPDLDGGVTCDAVTSHVDLLPTIVACAGGDDDAIADVPGHDISAAFTPGRPVGLNDVRDGALYNFNMFAFLDADMIRSAAEAKAAGTKPDKPPQPDFSKRGAIRSVHDGRHRYTRYFAPDQHNTPETLDDITAHNDIELFDLVADPLEAINLATDPSAATDDIQRMNALMNRIIDEEVGVDDGSFLPAPDETPWHVESWDI
jgi:arylsulfatase